MSVQILNDFHDDDVFRDQSGSIWIRQSELVDSMARAWDEGWQRGFRDMHAATRDEDGYIVVTPSPNPYKPSPFNKRIASNTAL